VTTEQAPARADEPAGTVRRTVLVGVATAALALVLALAHVAAEGGDPTVLLRVGTFAPARAYVEQDLPNPVLTPDYGHDGQQFYVLAGELPALDGATPYVDNVRYRARRILYPALVAWAPRGLPLVWAMLAANVVAIGAAGAGVARLAERLRAPPAVGVLVAVSPAMVESAQGSLGDATAFALALWAVVVWRRRPWLAVALLTLASLARETSLVAAVACALVAPGVWARLRMLVPLGLYGVWALLVSSWLPASEGTTGSIVDEALGQLGVPFRGWLQVGLADPAIVAGAILVGCSLVAAWWLRRALPEMSLWLLADAVLLVGASWWVANRPLNLARLAPLAIPMVVLALLAARRPAATPAAEPAV
jgi:hypothetical protein